VFFGRWGLLMAQPFDTRRLTFAPYEMIVSERISTAAGFSRAAVSVSERTLVFATTPAQSLATSVRRSVLRWYDRAGRAIADVHEFERLDGVELSPDERWLALYRSGVDGISLWDLARGGEAPFLPGGIQRSPVWSPSGRQLAFASRERDAASTRWQIDTAPALGAGGQRASLWTGAAEASPLGWSPDERVLLYVSRGGDAGDLWALSPGSGATPVPIAPGSKAAAHAQFSPDGRWIAYSARHGDDRVVDVFVQPYPPTGQKWIVSVDGGDEPRWRADGREIIYLSADRFVMAVDVRTQPGFMVGVPRRLFETRVRSATPGAFQYAISRDAERFLINTIDDAPLSAPISIVTNWRGALALVDSR
jgi:hypothetical protein